jgi:hypothetical protein
LNFFKGPSVILNSGSLNQSTLGKTDKYGKYSTAYVMGVGNRSFRELKRIVDQLIEDNNIKTDRRPWRVDDKTNMVSVFASSNKIVPVLSHDEKKVDVSEARDGDFCKLNVTPSAYIMEETATFRMPDGSLAQQQNQKTGVKLFLNGIKLLEPNDEELF